MTACFQSAENQIGTRDGKEIVIIFIAFKLKWNI